MTDVTDEFDAARNAAARLPTWLLRRWERRAVWRAAAGRPTQTELARLLGVRAVLNQRRDADHG